MPLFLVNSGEHCKVTTVGCAQDTRLRLTDMGITPGVSLKVLAKSASSFLISFRNTRLMLDTRLARQIQVSLAG